MILFCMAKKLLRSSPIMAGGDGVAAKNVEVVIGHVKKNCYIRRRNDNELKWKIGEKNWALRLAPN